jgi:hypothetical protein
MATRDLLQDSTEERFPAAFVSRQLACVAFYKFVTYSVLLVRGADGVDPDDAARTDCPVKPRELNRLHTRLERMRNAILHIGEKAGPATLVSVNWRRDPVPTLTLETTRENRGNTVLDSITRAEIESWLDRL